MSKWPFAATAAFVVVGLLTSLRPAHAAWPGEIAVCTAPTVPDHLAAVPDGSGGVIVAWVEARNPTPYNADVAVWAQRIDASGTTLWPTDGRLMVVLRNGSLVRVLDVNGVTQRWVAGDGQGGIWVAYQRSGSGGWVYHRRADGAADSLEVESIFTDGMDIAPDGAGGVFVAWVGPGPWLDGIYVQHVDASGTAQWPVGGVVVGQPAGTGAAYDAVVVADGSGGAVVAWSDERDGWLKDIYVQRVDVSGTPQWTTDGVRASSFRPPTTVDDYMPRLAADGTGGFVVAWAINGSPYYIEAQRLDASGSTTWGNTDVVPLAVGGDFAMVPVGDGGCMIAYSYGGDVSLRRIDDQGSPAWPGDVVLCGATGVQNRVAMTRGDDASAWVTWRDRRVGGKDLYAQGADTSGAILGAPDGDPVDTQPVSGWSYARETIVTVPGTGVVSAYMDTRNGNADVFARMIASAPATAVRPAPARGVRLGAPWPNPAGGATRISWGIDRAGRVDLSVYDVAGRRVRNLVRGRFGAGSHTARWDGRDAHGRRVASGVYFVRLGTPFGTRSRRLTMLR